MMPENYETFKRGSPVDIERNDIPITTFTSGFLPNFSRSSVFSSIISTINLYRWQNFDALPRDCPQNLKLNSILRTFSYRMYQGYHILQLNKIHLGKLGRYRRPRQKPPQKPKCCAFPRVLSVSPGFPQSFPCCKTSSINNALFVNKTTWAAHSTFRR